MDLVFSNSFDLYKRLLPCLNSKVREMQKNKMDIVKKEDIWNYLIKEKWKKTEGLTLDMMADDILNTDNKVIYDYTVDKISKTKREADFENIEVIM